MTVFRRSIYLALLVFCLFFMSYQPSSAQESAAQLEQLQQKNKQLHQQLRDARREIARLKVEDSAPGWKDVATGLGLIFGLSGVVMMANARRR
jgi:cell division protein FtsB